MNIACPECSTVYRLDPDRVPEAGAAAECRQCATRFRVDPTMGADAGEVVTAPRVEAAAAEPAAAAQAAGTAATTAETEGGAGTAAAPEAAGDSAEPAAAETGDGAPAFGPQDPETRAQRLARALVSDITVYHPDRWEASAEAGTLRTDFRDEIMKSWEEYVEQVGEDMAKKTPYFRDALNEILARGEQVF